MNFLINSRSDEIPLTLTATFLGQDLCVSLTGGDLRHIGAVALAQPYPSSKDPQRINASTSVITVCGHQEDRLACDLAEKITLHTLTRVSITCGIHLHEATNEQINQVIRISHRLVDELIAQLNN
jgi:hypothetical protein